MADNKLLDDPLGFWTHWLKSKPRSRNMKANNKFFGKNIIYLGVDIDCFKCGLIWTTNFESDWKIDFFSLERNWKAYCKNRNYNKFDKFMNSKNKQIGRHYCEKCAIAHFECDNCNKQTPVNNTDEWFIDEKFYLKDISHRDHVDKHKPANLCKDCRVFHGNGLIVCERCYKRGKWSINKWNTEEGHVQCYSCEMVVCYDCHDRIHYNK